MSEQVKEVRRAVTVFICGPKSCEHDWDGPVAELPDGGATATCSKCGAWAFNVYMLEGP